MAQPQEKQPEQPEVVTEEVKPRNVPLINPRNIVPATAGRNEWEVTVEAGTTPDDVLKPELWQSHNGVIRKWGDEVRITPKDKSWMMWAVVERVMPTFVKLKKIHLVEFGATLSDVDVVRGVGVRFGGSSAMYVLYYADTGKEITKGHESLEAAHIARVKYLEKMS